jgi:hypothetical protein
MDTLRVIYQGIHSKPSATAENVTATDYATRTGFRIILDSIHSNSIVLISASECIPDQYNAQRFTPVFNRHVGDAAITVQNIAPQEGFVDYLIYVDSVNPLDVMVDVVVLDPPKNMVVVDPGLQNQNVFQVDVRPQVVASVKSGTWLSSRSSRQRDA